MTACIGKRHLGMNLATTDGNKPFEKEGRDGLGKALAPEATNIDWKGVIKDGPIAVGFDKYYGISASLGSTPDAKQKNDGSEGWIINFGWMK